MYDNLIPNIKGILNATADKDLLNANANKASERIPVMRDLVAGEVSKALALEEILPKHIAEAHISGDIHYHDLDYAPAFPQANCMLIDLESMLTNGFCMGDAEIESPNSIQTATAITAQIIAQVASHIYGGNSLNRIDEVLAPYVRKTYNNWVGLLKGQMATDEKAILLARKLTEKNTYDAFQSLEYEINTLHTANGQTPFTTLGFGLGKGWEAELIQESILKNRLAGLGKHKKTAIFPKLVYTIKEGHNRKPGDPNYHIKKLALECASKRMYPDILNYDKLVEVTGGFKAPMGCRSFLHEHNGEYEGRTNMGVVSVNLPRLAINTTSTAEFFGKLDSVLALSKEALLTRVDRLRSVQAKVAPILYVDGAAGVRLDPEDYVFDAVFGNGRASISLGYIGLHEMASAMFPDDNKHTYDSQNKKEFIDSVLTHIKGAVDEWKEEHNLAFSLYSTPSESLCDRFCKLDVAKFGQVPGVTTKGYYTNSFHLDVQKKVSPYDKIDFEAEYPYYASGGFIVYAEFPNMVNNLKALEDVWDYSYNKVAYFGTNTPVDECHDCGFHGEATPDSDGWYSCPVCGNTSPVTLHVTRRVCGYLGTPLARPFISGKQEEVNRRIKHEIR